MVDRLFSDADLSALYDAAWSPRAKRDDFDFYLPMVMSAEAVLDVGCGTGAMLHEARDAGHKGRLCGLDPAPGMMAKARTRSDVEWVLGDLSSVTWSREFSLVVMTGHAFQALVEDKDLRVALAAIAAALTETGRFAFETRNPLARAWERWTPENAIEVAAAGNASVHIATEVVAPFDGETVSFTHTFSSPSWKQPQVSQSTLRFLDASTLALFLTESGLQIEEQFGDWNQGPLTDQSPEIITLVRVSDPPAR